MSDSNNHSIDIYSPPPLPEADSRPADRDHVTSFDRNASILSDAYFTAQSAHQRNPSLDSGCTEDCDLEQQPPRSDGGGRVASMLDVMRGFYGSGDEDDSDDAPGAGGYIRRVPSHATVASVAQSVKGGELGNVGVSPVELTALEKERGCSDEEIWDAVPRWKQFIVQFNVSHFGVAIGMSAHMSLWRSLSLNFEWLRIPQQFWFALWFLSVAVFTVEVVIYAIRAMVFPKGVRRDFYNNRFVNFFMAPVIVLSSVVSAVPPFLESNGTVGMVLDYMLIIYQLLFALYIYGDWLFSKVFSLQKIDPTYQMAVVGFFLVSRVASEQGDVSGAKFNLSVGILFWLVVFIALFLNVAVAFRSKSLSPSPTMFLLLAPPAAAALAVVAMETAEGNPRPFNDLATFFVMADSFIFLLLLRLLPVWIFQTFNIAWWAYIFPLSTASTALVAYAVDTHILFWKVVSVMSWVVALVVILIVAVTTVVKFAQGELPVDGKARALYCQCVRIRRYHESKSSESEVV